MASKTKNYIVSAFLKLIDTRELDKITVTDLVEQCSISRQTFYYHFDDIDKMLEWSFKMDTDNVCSKIRENNDISSYITFFADFMNKYDTLFKKSMNTSHFIFIYNLLGNFFYETTLIYFSKIYKSINNNHESVIRFWSNSILSYAVGEMQQTDSDYEAVFKTINSYIPKQNKE